MPGHYGGGHHSSSFSGNGSPHAGTAGSSGWGGSNNTGSSVPDDRGDDDKALSYVNWNQPTISTPSDGGGDIDSIYTDTSFNVTPEVQEKSFVDKVIDYYKGGGLLGVIAGNLGQPENQYAGITGEDEYGHGDYVSTQGDWAASKGYVDNAEDYYGLDLEEQQIIDQEMFDAGVRSQAFKDLYEGGDISNIDNLTSSESTALEQLIPTASYAIANQTPVESQVDKWFASNPVGTGLDPNYMTTYNTAKAQIANTLGMVDTSNQFGYSATPYGGLTAQNLTTNPFNIPYMQQRGLI